eukprot:1157743-Pelagomonas_calceolata.AAC.5
MQQNVTEVWQESGEECKLHLVCRQRVMEKHVPGMRMWPTEIRAVKAAKSGLKAGKRRQDRGTNVCALAIGRGYSMQRMQYNLHSYWAMTFPEAVQPMARGAVDSVAQDKANPQHQIRQCCLQDLPI